MASRKQLINEIANKVFEHLLLEVGEGVKPYDFEVTNDSKNRMEMTFTIPPDTEHDAPVEMLVIFNVDTGRYIRAELEFKPTTGNYGTINRNQVYKTMSTVMACTEHFLQRRPDVQFLVYKPTDERRKKLYSVYLKKALQDTELGDEFGELPGESGVVRKINSALRMPFADLVHKRARKILKGANLRSYPLTGAYLQHAQLQHANLQRANLQRANLYHVDLYKANLQGADLRGVQNLETCEGLNTVKYDKKTIWPDGFDIHKYQKK